MGGEMLRCGRRTAKGVTGYDLVAGFVGTEGTFGVITELTLQAPAQARPRPRPCSACSPTSPAAGAAITALLRGGLRPRVLELADGLDRHHPRRRAAIGSPTTPARSC